MNKADIKKRIYRWKCKYNPVMRRKILGNVVGLIGTSFNICLFLGWGWYIWCLSAGFSFWEKVLWVIGSYALGAIFTFVASIPGVGCIPVKFDRRD